MKIADFHAAQAKAMSESTLEGHVAKTCADLKAHGLLRYHTHRSQHSPAGFPDDVICSRHGMLWRELKREDGKVSPEQVLWLDRLTLLGYDVGIWRPSDWLSGRITREIAALLRPAA